MAATTATTLAARMFRFLIALIAAFGLEMRQYDIVNAYINASLDETSYVQHPDGFQRASLIKLLRASYGLWQFSALWQAHFSETFESFGLLPIPGIPCLYIKHDLIVFFFVDDIIVACHKRSMHLVSEFELKLASRYTIKRIGVPEYFLGIRILRNMADKTISLLKDAYIEKIASKFNLTNRKRVSTPMPVTPLVGDPNAKPEFIFLYQQNVASINFSATISRPDIAKACSLLSEHLMKPS